MTMTDCTGNTLIDDPCSASSGLPVGTDSGIAASCNAITLDNVINGNEPFYYSRTGKKVRSLSSTGLLISDGNIVKLDNFKNNENTWNEALTEALTEGWGVLFPKDGLVTFDSQVNINQADLTRRLFLNGCRVEFMADAIVDCDHFVIEGSGTIFLNTTVVTVNKGRLTFTENVKYLDVCRGVDFEGDLKIAQLSEDMVGPTNVMKLQQGHGFEVGKHVTSSWNNNRLPNSASRVPSPNTGNEAFLNRAESIVGNTVTLSYDIAALTIPSPAYIFQNTRFDRDFIRVLGDGIYRFEDVTFNYSPSYMISVRDSTMQARVFFDNVQAYNYAIDGFVLQCFLWEASNCKFGQQYDPSKSLGVVQIPKDGAIRWDNIDSRRGNADAEIFVFGIQEFPDITIVNSYLDGKNLQPFELGVYNSPAPADGNQININDSLHVFVPSADGVVTENYDGGSFNTSNTRYKDYQRTIFGTTYAKKVTFKYTSFNMDNCECDCTPAYFLVEDEENSSFGPCNITNSKIECSTYTLNGEVDVVVNYTNCTLHVDNSNPLVVTDGAPVRIANANLASCSLSGWWQVKDASNVSFRDVALYPKEGANPITLSISDPFFNSKDNNFILKELDTTTLDSFIPMLDYFGGNAFGSDFSPNSPFKVPFRIEGSNVDFETSNEYFFSTQAGVASGNESYRANLYREREEYPPLPTKGAVSLYVPINSMVSSNIDNTDLLVTNRSAATVTSGVAQEGSQFSISVDRVGIDSELSVGDFVGVYYATFNNVYWYRITGLTNTSAQNFDLTVDRFPTPNGITGVFQDISTGDEAYWFKTESEVDQELPVGYGAKLTATGIAGDEISASFTNIFFTGTEYDDSNGGFYANPPFINFPSGLNRVDLSALVIYPSNSVESGGYYQLQLAQYTSANTFIRLVADSGKCVAPINATDITVNINAIGVNVNDGDYFILRGRGTAFTTSPQPFTSAAVTIKKAK